jgi:hypothetical protein
MELTVNQIKEKQKLLENDLRTKLNQFEKETGLKVTGEIYWGYTQEKDQNWLSLKYSNPFM